MTTRQSLIAQTLKEFREKFPDGGCWCDKLCDYAEEPQVCSKVKEIEDFISTAITTALTSQADSVRGVVPRHKPFYEEPQGNCGCGTTEGLMCACFRWNAASAAVHEELRRFDE